MYTLFLLTSLFFVLILALMSLTIFLTMDFYPNRNTSSPFECGFTPKDLNRFPFSLQFFLIALIFLIFDIEITILLPLPFCLNTFHPQYFFLLSLFILFILIFGLILEWKNGALNWIK